MAVNETIVTGRKFRKLIDETTKLWQRISFWTKASDVEFDDGENAETKFTNILKIVDDLKQGFQDGVNKIYDKLSELGFTPNTNSPDDVNEAIQGIYDKRYVDGINDGFNHSLENKGTTKITYKYHVHDKSCYSTVPVYETVSCNGHVTRGNFLFNNGIEDFYEYTCDKCGKLDGAHTNGAHKISVVTGNKTVLSCGKNSTTIIGAEIDFNH